MTQDRCPQCGTPLPAKAPESLCPKCLLKLGLGAELEAGWQGEAGSPSPDLTHASPFRRGVAGPPLPEELQRHFPGLEILELIGQGGMGAVYKARHRELDRLVALKVLPPQVSGDAAFAERFSREARALARLTHPHIVAIFDSGRVDGLYYFVMEYVDGVNLRQAMHSGRLSPEEALAIVPQICEALQYAHDEGIVHRDIKPENVLVDSRGRVKIADFGLAKLLGHESADVTLTQTRQVMGTPRYMAPEQMNASHAVDHRADIYSLGVVFYELLTGEVPMGRFEPPSQRVPVDARLDQIVLRTLEREPRRRYQAASELKSDVETVTSSPDLKPLGEASRRPPQPVTTAEAERDKARSEVRVPAIGLIVVGALTVLFSPLPALVPLTFLALTPVRFESSRSDLEHVQDAPWDARQGDGPLDQAEPARSAEVARGEERPQASSESPQPSITLAPVLLIALVLGVLPTLVIGVLIASGGWRMLSLERSGFAVFAAVLALLPCQPLFILGLVFGIWSLVVLNRPHVRSAFDGRRGDRHEMNEPPQKPLPSDEEFSSQAWHAGRSKVQRVLRGTMLFVHVICFLLFFSFRFTGQMVFAPGHEQESTYHGTIGAPAAWYVVQRDAGGHSSRVNLYSPSFLLLLVALVAYWMYVRLRRKENQRRLRIWEQPPVVALIWTAMAVVMVTFAQAPLWW